MFEIPNQNAPKPHLNPEIKDFSEKVVLKVYAEFEVTEGGLHPLTHKAWFDVPKKKASEEQQKPLLVSEHEEEVQL